MSPLACSLLALAALLAAADVLGERCTTKTVGRETDHPVPLGPVHIDPPARRVILPDDACGQYYPYEMPVGETIVCCNTDPYSDDPPPVIDGPDFPPYVSPFDVHVYDRAGCDCRITQYCGTHYYKN